MHLICGPKHDQRTFEFALPTVDKIGIFVSGGLDSALLYYLALLEQQRTASSCEIFPIVILRKEGSRYFARPIIKKINNLFGIKTKILRLGNTTLPEPEQVSSAVKQSFILPPYLNTVFVGVINNRPEHMVGIDHIPVPEHEQIIAPFKHLEKVHIIDLYHKFDICHLFKYTHSCDRYEQQPCGACNGCKERAWGFSELGKQDPIYNDTNT